VNLKNIKYHIVRKKVRRREEHILVNCNILFHVKHII
jgi:hypothetical protein